MCIASAAHQVVKVVDGLDGAISRFHHVQDVFLDKLRDFARV
jgi:hypothetical protein